MDTEKIEQIGKVKLDLTYYAGEDLYCDGAVEDELLQIARDYAEVEYPRLIEERKSWEILYHLSYQRENIVEWLPLDNSMKVLEVGAGCGAITGVLSGKAGHVDCVDLSKKRSMINAYRHMESENVTIFVGNFQDIEPSLPCDYDYICLIGAFEYAQAYIGGDKPFETFLNIVRRHMKKNGRIVIAIENKFGLKYWAGCREDHLGTYFSGIEGYPEGGVVRTFTRKGLEKIFKNCGIEEYAFYYPYPDYKFMTTLYSDERLPKPGELSNNARNFDRDRMVLFDEKKAFDTILREEMFPVYSNSYLVVIGEKPDTCYVKYSNDRQREYRIRTEILPVSLTGMEDRGGITEEEKSGLPKLLAVRKHPLCEEADRHVRNIEVAYRKLKERYTGGELRINRCKLVEDEGMPYVELEYIQGVTLAELMDACLEQDDMEGFLALFRKYLTMLDYHSKEPVADFDLIFSNILIGTKDTAKPFDALENSIWTLIDYEWTFGKQVDTRELAFRAVYCYILEDSKRDRLRLDMILEELGITDQDAEEYRAQEKAFQHFVTGRHRSMVELRDMIGNRCFEPESFLERIIAEEHRGSIQIYEDRGAGFQEESSFFAHGMVEEDDQGLHLVLTVEHGIRQLRIDPGFADCMVRVKELKWNERDLPFAGKDSVLDANGTRLDDSGSFVFPTDDPNLVVSLEGQMFEEVNVLELCMERSFMGREMAQDIESAAKRRLRL
ncbi:MAG: class I SAM-dependent methyltransferase [Lachnospiraceae bacterium]|jgi:SAM-dependent methyltransferase|nr:class I SAM-dependent methyltransferase [Lachnospiraceae bacterium]